MWYFYRKFDSEEITSIVAQVNDLFIKILDEHEFVFPDWMEPIILKEYFKNLKSHYRLSLDEEKTKLIDSFNMNTQIERICKNEISPISYEELLRNASTDFIKCIENIKLIQEYLYENLLKLKHFSDKAMTFKNYYENFYKETIEYVCPFCGLDNMLTSKDLYREAFDHYLPKSKYPFVSFLRENLFPICNTCNSLYKNDKNPNDYGKSFYPFTAQFNDCKLSFEIISGKIEETEINSNYFQEEIETWNSLLDIKNRINNFADFNLNGWVSNISEAMRNYGVDFEHALNAEIKACKPQMQDHKFVKKAVLEALQGVEEDDALPTVLEKILLMS
ncbi:hypothetical protein PV433_31550 [Paenibacillus sp. GYB004]|uniref:hypothetical protein n=1 Tax=Paenibacillus sp. GYB004 TaxID=2994393 RepID=UPI002F96D1C0